MKNKKLNEILKKVSYFYEVSEIDIKSRRKNKKELVIARHVYCFLARQTTDLTQVKIGKLIGRDHASVWYSEIKVKNLMDVYPEFREEVLSLLGKVDISKSPLVVKDVDLLQLSQYYTQSIL